MVSVGENLALAADAIRAHKLRASLTVLGLTLGVATLITVMTIVQGANLYVEQKIADLGTNVFRISRTPFAVTDFTQLTKAQRYRFLYPDDVKSLTETCGNCQMVGATFSSTTSLHYKDKELEDTTLFGHTPSMRLHRYAHGRPGALLHRSGGPACCQRLPDRRQRGPGVLSRCRSVGQMVAPGAPNCE